MEGDGPIQLVNRDAIPRPDLLGLLNVKYVAAEFLLDVDGLREIARFDSTYLYQNELYLPRAFVVGQTRQVTDYGDALSHLTNTFDGSLALVEGGPLLIEDDDASISYQEITPNRVELEVRLNNPGLLVISQAWYTGWQAWVDGQRVELHHVDGVLTDILLGSGIHLVKLIYRPVTLLWGLGLSVTGFTFSALIFLSKRFTIHVE